MNDDYTQVANDRCFDLIDTDLAEIWSQIENMPPKTAAAVWLEKLRAIAAEYTFSSRFALMRLMTSRAYGTAPGMAPKRGFTSCLDGETYRFGDISMDHAMSLTPEELALYERLLLSTAAKHGEVPQEDAALIRKALAPEGTKKTLLTREEALRLGHVLGFSLPEMQWFLLRAFDIEDGFRYNRSDDLIEAYCFLTGAGWREAVRLKDEYASRAAHIEKRTDGGRRRDWTRNNQVSLPERVASWPPEDRDGLFLAWLTERAPYLDQPSQTALRVYRNLAVYAYDLAKGEEETPVESDFEICMREIAEEPEEDDGVVRVLYENGTLSAEKCEQVAGELLRENLDRSFSDEADKAKPWSTIKVLSTGKMSRAVSRTRVRDLLLGAAEVEKHDLLYLLWFTATLIWSWNTAIGPGEIYDRLADFIEASRECLDNAMLPAFYPPHLAEQSMMLAIVYAGGGGEDPAEVYESICSSVIVHRAKHTKARKKDRPD